MQPPEKLAGRGSYSPSNHLLLRLKAKSKQIEKVERAQRRALTPSSWQTSSSSSFSP